ncbi:hypothetical protein TYRP_005820 [Tyrophagus putrescentiae]|nr:hypothetical protein TYRP_005820 [Tyrophagus putrescentiae]
MSRKRLRSTFSGSEAVVNFASGFIRGSSSNSRVKSWSWKFSELKTMMRELIDVGMGFARLAEGLAKAAAAAAAAAANSGASSIRLAME